MAHSTMIPDTGLRLNVTATLCKYFSNINIHVS